MRAPSVIQPVQAYSTLPVPRVAMKESILANSTSRPLNTPMRPLPAMTTRQATGQGQPLLTMSCMASTWERPRP